MGFKWIDAGLEHTDAGGNVNVIKFEDIPQYFSNLPPSEKQEPLPEIPTVTAADGMDGAGGFPPSQDVVNLTAAINADPARVAADPAIMEAAASNPDAIIAAINSALAQAKAGLDAAQEAYNSLLALSEKITAQIAQAAPIIEAAPAPVETAPTVDLNAQAAPADSTTAPPVVDTNAETV